MSWVKLDDAFHRNPKVRLAGLEGRALYVAGLCHCAAGLTDGVILKAMLPIIAAEAEVPASNAQTLVDLGLWIERDADYLVNDYLVWNPSGEHVRKTRAARAEAGRRGGQASKPGSKSEANASANEEANGEAKSKPIETPSPSPSPSPLSVVRDSSFSHRSTYGDPFENEPKWRRLADAMEARGESRAKTFRTIRRLIEVEGIADHLIDAASGQTIAKDGMGLGYFTTIARDWYSQRVSS